MRALFLMLALSAACAAAEPDTTANQAVTDLLRTVRRQHDVPALAGAIVTSKGLVAHGVVGVRKRGTDVPATLNDQWHLGSNTKAMTAVLVARLVEHGHLKWTTTVADVFPEMQSELHPDMRGITVVQLLSHRSGLPANPDLARFLGIAAPKERLRVLREELAKNPRSKPGTEYCYSNLGYIVVGAIIERITGRPWQKEITAQVFRPLGMKHVGFGGTGTLGQIDQPWGHTALGWPVGLNGPLVDNPPVMGPAGRVHCTMADWARFIADQLRGRRGEGALLEKETYAVLHTPPAGGEYALGWIVVSRPWGGGLVLNHAGSNTMNLANVWVAPRRDFAVLVCTNQGGDRAQTATDAAATALIDYYLTHHPDRPAADQPPREAAKASQSP